MQAIEAGRLVLVCGAGVSMDPPSSIPSARAVAHICFDEYQNVMPGALGPADRDDLTAIAEHFVHDGSLESYFIRALVPWRLFTPRPNAGHEAIADMLLCKAFAATITTNYDFNVEQCAVNARAAFDSSLNAAEAAAHRDHSPFLKIHGCAVRDKAHTVWAPTQLTNDDAVRGRIEGLKVWLEANLPDKDFLFIGFWSDWAYLNAIIGEALSNVKLANVILIDPDNDGALRQKAPQLWEKCHAEGVRFRHLPMEGSEFLNLLRAAFSRLFLRKAIAEGEAEFEREFGSANVSVPIASMSNNSDLYAARCDAEGIPRTEAARRRVPLDCGAFGFAHLLLTHAGAAAAGANYVREDKVVWVINGAGRFIPDIQDAYSKESPALPSPDLVICAGAIPSAVPHSIVRTPETPSVVRPGISGVWLDLPHARSELKI